MICSMMLFANYYYYYGDGIKEADIDLNMQQAIASVKFIQALIGSTEEKSGRSMRRLEDNI